MTGSSGCHDVAGGHVHLDDGHIPEVADIRDSNVHVRLQGSKVAAETVTGSGRLEHEPADVFEQVA